MLASSRPVFTGTGSKLREGILHLPEFALDYVQTLVYEGGGVHRDAVLLAYGILVILGNEGVQHVAGALQVVVLERELEYGAVGLGLRDLEPCEEALCGRIGRELAYGNLPSRELAIVGRGVEHHLGAAHYYCIAKFYRAHAVLSLHQAKAAVFAGDDLEEQIAGAAAVAYHKADGGAVVELYRAQAFLYGVVDVGAQG